MAVAYVGASNAAGQSSGSAAASTVSITPTLPAGSASGDRIFVIQVGSNTSGTTPTNWTVLGTKDTTVGSGSVASGSGARRMTVYYRDYDGVWTMPAFTLTSATNNSHWIGAVAVRRSRSAYTWDTPTISTVGAAFNTATTSYTDSSAASFTTHPGGFVIVGTALNDNVTSTTVGLTQTGATFGTITERCDGGTGTGNIVSGKVHTGPVSLGAAATTTFTLTLSAASQGESLIIEQTESGPLMETLASDFDSGLGSWVASTPAQVTATGGTVRIDHPSAGTYITVSYPAAYDLTGSYALVEVPDYGTFTTSHQRYLQLVNDTNSGVQLGADGNSLFAYKTVLGTGALVGSTTLDATNHRWLRIRHSGANLLFETSPDGSTSSWTTRWTLATSFGITAVYPYLSTGAWQAEASGSYVVFDNFNNPPTGSAGTLATALQKLSASFTGDMLPSATVATSLIKLGFSGTGTQTQTGTLATSLQKTSMSATGVMQPAGTLAAALLPLVATATGTQTQTGTLATAVQKLAFTGAGAQTLSGTMGTSLQKLAASLSGWMEPSGTLAAALQKLALSATGDQTIPGTLGAALLPLVLSAIGTQTQTGSMAATLQKLAATLTGSQTLSGTVSTSLKPVIFTGAGEQIYSGTLSTSLQKLTFSSTGTLTVTGTLTASLLPLQLSATGAVSGAPANMTTALQPLVASFTGTMLPTGALTAALQKLAFSGQATQTQTGTLATTLQKLTASATGDMPPSGSLDAVLGLLAFSASGGQLQEGALAAALQPLVASIVGGVTPEGTLAAQLAALVMQASGSGGVPIGVLAAVLPALVAHVVARAYRLALERMTVVEVQDRTTHVSLQDRVVVVEIPDRTSVVTVPDRTTTVELQDRTTTVIREV